MARYRRARDRLLDHAIARARERYGIRLARDDCRRLAAEIAAGRAAELERKSRTVAVFAVWHGPRLLAALYDFRAGAIRTFFDSAKYGMR